ncbi:peptidase S53 [Pseudoduganella sp. FT25W]|uniref:Peptidase S53 n=1 Tax=Duganella alba TaxID=2666081 RepID=A0A6L5QM83_9BURK|nr:S53 family peptidase [Duganella alba]MRX10777.1 peptidase S53 [Duganella alba]MRX18896.1 peptidase S53 [Duganella alba]
MKTKLLLLCVALGAITSGVQAITLPGAAPLAKPRVSADPRIVDLGLAASSDVKTISLSLALRNADQLDTFIAGLAEPANPNFRKFITPQQFAAAYGQTPESVAAVVSYLKSKGFTVNKVFANNLQISASGTNAQIAAAFGVSVHNYSLLGKRFQAPVAAPAIPAALASVVKSVNGISTRSVFNKRSTTIPRTGALAGDVGAKVAGAIGGTPGQYTTVDLAAKYNINPLYARGVTGAGRTIGIATLAGYAQSDAYTYWQQLALPIKANRIVDVVVDGGPLPDDGPGSDGAGETTLDVQQSGGVAPGAKLRVYLAPNTDAGFIDVFAQAVDENLVDVLSVSWGSPEVYSDDATLVAFHNVFLQAAAQGIPVIAAAGDAGAFDINRGLPYPHCSTLLGVDFPAADPLVLAAGGTTLPNTSPHKFGNVTVPTERAWGWDYLKNYIVTNYGTDLYYSDYLAVGGGGGVSALYGVPSFQKNLTGVQKTAAAQSLICENAVFDNGSGYGDYLDVPANLAGRNLPDVSLNADPYSGYAVYFGGAWSTGSGGTSFVAPQLNGILTLISAGLNGRVGPINPQLYAAFKTYGYGAGSPFKPISAGTNQYYQSTATYNPATGLGSLDVNALAKALGVK